MKTATKLALLHVFGVGLFGFSMGLTDYINSTNLNSLLMGDVTRELYPNLFWNTSVLNSLTNVLAFLVLPAVSLLFTSLVTYLLGVKVGMLPLKVLVCLFCSSGVLISAVWDTTFAFLTLTTWNYLALSETVLWLPFYGGGIAFTWQSSVYFIFARLVVCILLYAYAFSNLEVKPSWGTLYVRRRI